MFPWISIRVLAPLLTGGVGIAIFLVYESWVGRFEVRTNGDRESAKRNGQNALRGRRISYGSGGMVKEPTVPLRLLKNVSSFSG